jgi:hypothetical protein
MIHEHGQVEERVYEWVGRLAAPVTDPIFLKHGWSQWGGIETQSDDYDEL